MALCIPRSIFSLARLLYVRPETLPCRKTKVAPSNLLGVNWQSFGCSWNFFIEYNNCVARRTSHIAASRNGVWCHMFQEWDELWGWIGRHESQAHATLSSSALVSAVLSYVSVHTVTVGNQEPLKRRTSCGYLPTLPHCGVRVWVWLYPISRVHLLLLQHSLRSCWQGGRSKPHTLYPTTPRPQYRSALWPPGESSTPAYFRSISQLNWLARWSPFER